jgi:hypothetical protein
MAAADIEAAAAIQVDAFGGVLADVVGRYHDGPRYSWRDAWVVERPIAAAVAIRSPGGFAAVVRDQRDCRRPSDRRSSTPPRTTRARHPAPDKARGTRFRCSSAQHGFYRRLGWAASG